MSITTIGGFISGLADGATLYTTARGLRKKQPSSPAPVFVPLFASSSGVGIQSYHFANQKTDFTGRDAEMEALRLFVTDDRPFLWWAVCGCGGSGKSRLALELYTEIAQDDVWQAGFVDVGATPLTIWKEWKPEKNTLLIIDYAGKLASYGADSEAAQGKKDVLSSIVATLQERAKKGEFSCPVRVLFLEREYKEKTTGKPTPEQNILAWYAELISPHSHAGRLSCDAQYEIPLELQPLSDEALYAIGTQVTQQLAKQSEEAHEADTNIACLPESFVSDLQEIDSKKRPLFAIFLATFLAKDDGVESDDVPTRSEVLAYGLEMEFVKAWQPAGLTDEDVRLLVLATITGQPRTNPAWKEDNKKQRCMKNFGLGWYDNDTGEFFLVPVEPDLFGEYFALHGAGIEPGGGQRIPTNDLKQLIQLAWKEAPQDTAVFFERCRQDFLDEKTELVLNLFLDQPKGEQGQLAWAIVAANMIANLGDVDDARTVFDAMFSLKQNDEMQVLSALASVDLILNYIDAEDVDSAEDIYEGMVAFGDKQTVQVSRSYATMFLISEYAKVKDMPKAQDIYDGMAAGNSEKMRTPRAFAISSLALGYFSIGKFVEAEKYIRELDNYSDIPIVAETLEELHARFAAAQEQNKEKIPS